jgi:hypothetical protein
MIFRNQLLRSGGSFFLPGQEKRPSSAKFTG